jgi:calcineurin-like phosphoesterase family protein
MANVFLISDTHFGHTNIIKYCDRPFANVDEMDGALIKNWNSVVGPQDKVYHLGDVTLSTKKMWIMDQLNGKKILIKGNHDIFPLKVYTPYFKDIRGSHEIAGLLLTHIPVHKSQFTRYKANVHGHLHEKTLKERGYYSVCVEQINYTPIALDDLLLEVK